MLSIFMRSKKDKEKQKAAVDESVQVQKAREKLKKKLEELDEKVTKQALERKSLEICRCISKNASERIALQAKEISLFDENQNTAKVSRKVSLMAEKIKKDAQLLQELMKTPEKALE